MRIFAHKCRRFILQDGEAYSNIQDVSRLFTPKHCAFFGSVNL
jgi:hypothetical protein